MSDETIKRYQIKEKIGAGGMGTVYRAWDRELQRDVALKWLPAVFGDDEMLTERFKREIRVIAHLEHQNIVPIYDVGESDGRPFIIMRLYDGGTLNDQLKRGSYQLADLITTLQEIAGALAAAHERQIVHRDIKPGNILFDAHGTAFLSDFGIAKVLDSGTQLTGSSLIGTPAYMSPEQFTGQGIDGRSDQYSLAVVAYEALSGSLPFEGNTAQMMYKHLNVDAPEIDLDQHPIPAGLNPILQRALAKEPGKRYARVTDFATAMAIAMRMEPATSAIVLPVVAGPPKGTAPDRPTPATEADTLSREYQAGLEALALGQWAAAQAAFERVLTVAPDYGNAAEFSRQAQVALDQATTGAAAAASEATTIEPAPAREAMTPAHEATPPVTVSDRTMLEGTAAMGPAVPPPLTAPPPAQDRKLPMWLLGLIALLLLLGIGYVAVQMFGGGGDREPSAADSGVPAVAVVAEDVTTSPSETPETPPTSTQPPAPSATSVAAALDGGDKAGEVDAVTGSDSADSDGAGSENAAEAALPQPILDGSQATSTEAATVEPSATAEPPTAEPSETPPGQAAVRVIVSSANLRSGPGTIYPTAGAIFNGEEATVLATNRDGTWYNVQLPNGSRAWIAASVTEPVNAVAVNSVAVAATIPAAPTLTPVPPTATPLPTSPPPPTQPPADSGGGGSGGGGSGGGGGGGGDSEPPPPPKYTAEPP
ncbi:MAG: protein kinase domain-containing protein [Candidatus Promineifilaceae bacterium]